MTNSNVAILGCGPAGLFAAHAAELAGFNPTIISVKRKSEMFGAQYLHRPIPQVSGEGFDVKYELVGSVEDYKLKVYGQGYRGTVSPEDLVGDHQGWDIRSAYDLLWGRYQDSIYHTPFEGGLDVAGFIGAVMQENRFGHYLSTIPANLLCYVEDHGFSAEQVWSIGDAPERGTFSPITSDLNTVVCSGDKDHGWYRKSNILGYNTVEWPRHRKPPFEGVAPVIKPLVTNCDCLPEVHRLGRYGKWQKGILSHEAFYETFAGLAKEPWSE